LRAVPTFHVSHYSRRVKYRMYVNGLLIKREVTIVFYNSINNCVKANQIFAYYYYYYFFFFLRISNVFPAVDIVYRSAILVLMYCPANSHDILLSQSLTLINILFIHFNQYYLCARKNNSVLGKLEFITPSHSECLLQSGLSSSLQALYRI
jgi:hypothetical protein